MEIQRLTSRLLKLPSTFIYMNSVVNSESSGGRGISLAHHGISSLSIARLPQQFHLSGQKDSAVKLMLQDAHFH